MNVSFDVYPNFENKMFDGIFDRGKIDEILKRDRYCLIQLVEIRFGVVFLNINVT